MQPRFAILGRYKRAEKRALFNHPEHGWYKIMEANRVEALTTSYAWFRETITDRDHLLVKVGVKPKTFILSDDIPYKDIL